MLVPLLTLKKFISFILKYSGANILVYYVKSTHQATCDLKRSVKKCYYCQRDYAVVLYMEHFAHQTGNNKFLLLLNPKNFKTPKGATFDTRLNFRVLRERNKMEFKRIPGSESPRSVTQILKSFIYPKLRKVQTFHLNFHVCTHSIYSWVSIVFLIFLKKNQIFQSNSTTTFLFMLSFLVAIFVF